MTLAQSVGAGLLGAKVSHVTEKNYSMQFKLHITLKIKGTDMQLK
jgi:hypothetical protein